MLLQPPPFIPLEQYDSVVKCAFGLDKFLEIQLLLYAF